MIFLIFNKHTLTVPYPDDGCNFEGGDQSPKIVKEASGLE